MPGRVIYMGSIPYDQTEEQVLDIASSIGPVANLKMMFDKDTGRSKGFAFVEYNDVETASSAVRNLNNYSIGNRQLKCDFSSEQSLSSGNSNTNNNSTNNSNGLKHSRRDELPPLPSGITLSQGESYAESISRTLKGLDPVRQQKLIQEAIVMSKRNPVLMEQLLSQCPQLSYALVETLLVTNTAKPDAISQILLSNVKAEAQAQEQQQQQQQTQQQQQQQEEPLDEERIALIKQVIAIPDEDLQGLPEDQRLPILEIKQNYANGVYGTLSL